MWFCTICAHTCVIHLFRKVSTAKITCANTYIYDSEKKNPPKHIRRAKSWLIELLAQFATRHIKDLFSYTEAIVFSKNRFPINRPSIRGFSGHKFIRISKRDRCDINRTHILRNMDANLLMRTLRWSSIIFLSSWMCILPKDVHQTTVWTGQFCKWIYYRVESGWIRSTLSFRCSDIFEGIFRFQTVDEAIGKISIECMSRK